MTYIAKYSAASNLGRHTGQHCLFMSLLGVLNYKGLMCRIYPKYLDTFSLPVVSALYSEQN